VATTDTQTLVTKVATRARDASNIAHSRADVVEIMSHAQRAVNSRLRSFVKTVAVTPVAGRSLYVTSEIAADAVRPIAIRVGVRDLTEVCWTSLVANDGRWLRTTGKAPQVFATIGRTMYAVVPAYAGLPQDLTVVYIPALDDLDDDVADFPVIADEHVPLMLDLTEALLLMRARVLEPAQLAMERFAAALDREAPEMDRRNG
jgi:hypothetical protein